MRLSSGYLFPIPVIQPVEPGSPIRLDQDVAFRDNRNELLAIMTIEEVYPWDREEVARKIFAILDVRHPLVAEMPGARSTSLGGFGSCSCPGTTISANCA